jgi:hypothetical protein
VEERFGDEKVMTPSRNDSPSGCAGSLRRNAGARTGFFYPLIIQRLRKCFIEMFLQEREN